jgi:hypothetical protein
MDRFPKMLYRFPATSGDPVQLQDGIYNTLIVDDEVAHDNALEAGWHETPPDARQAHADALEQAQVDAKLAEAGRKAADTSDDGVPATRAELEQKATELGIEFSPKIGDAKLAERIAAKLAEAGV